MNQKPIENKYGALSIVERKGDWALVQCDCGKRKEVRVFNLVGNRTKSCGCGLGSKKHVLSDLNTDKLTALCTLCGATPLRITKGGKARCWVSEVHAKVSYEGEALEKWDAQAGFCKLCKGPMKRFGTEGDSACLDHDHTTQLIRGFLCFNCNRGLGLFHDSPSILRFAANYCELQNSFN